MKKTIIFIAAVLILISFSKYSQIKRSVSAPFKVEHFDKRSSGLKKMVQIINFPEKLFAGEKYPLIMPNEDVKIISENENIAKIENRVIINAKAPGKCTVKSLYKGVEKIYGLEVVKREKDNYKRVDFAGTEVPASLKSETWYRELTKYILPYWTSTEALGKPVGNFPTYRDEYGQELNGSDRKVRMMSRQIYGYSMAYLMTGDEKLLSYANSGVRWLISNAYDRKNGCWYPDLDSKGKPLADEPKFSQDIAYTLMGLSAYFFVTRDKEVEKLILETRDTLFKKFWDDQNKRVVDGMNAELIREVYQDGGAESWELVAQLDQINAYLMLIQPVLTEENRKKEFLNDMIRLVDTMQNSFWKDGIFWGQKDKIGRFNTRHVDFGHTLKSYWMIHQLDKRLDGNPYYSFFNGNAEYWLNLAYHEDKGIWHERMDSPANGVNEASWWVYAICDQLAATVNMRTGKYTDILKVTAENWSKNFIDKERGGVYSDMHGGSKQNEWKSSYHETEHALVMYIHGKVLEDSPLPLYFAVNEKDSGSFIAKPYIFNGKEEKRKELENIAIAGKKLKKVRVEFSEIY